MFAASSFVRKPGGLRVAGQLKTKRVGIQTRPLPIWDGRTSRSNCTLSVKNLETTLHAKFLSTQKHAISSSVDTAGQFPGTSGYLRAYHFKGGNVLHSRHWVREQQYCSSSGSLGQSSHQRLGNSFPDTNSRQERVSAAATSYQNSSSVNNGEIDAIKRSKTGNTDPSNSPSERHNIADSESKLPSEQLQAALHENHDDDISNSKGLVSKERNGEPSASKVSRSKKMSYKELLKKYGSTAFVFHTVVWVGTLGVVWAGVAHGPYDPNELVAMIPYVDDTMVPEGAGSFALAYTLTALTSPARIALDVACTPWVASKVDIDSYLPTSGLGADMLRALGMPPPPPPKDANGDQKKKETNGPTL